MEIFQKMYAILCGAMSEAVDALERGLPEDAEAILREGLLTAESQYIQQGRPDISQVSACQRTPFPLKPERGSRYKSEQLNGKSGKKLGRSTAIPPAF